MTEGRGEAGGDDLVVPFGFDVEAGALGHGEGGLGVGQDLLDGGGEGWGIVGEAADFAVLGGEAFGAYVGADDRGAGGESFQELDADAAAALDGAKENCAVVPVGG